MINPNRSDTMKFHHHLTRTQQHNQTQLQQQQQHELQANHSPAQVNQMKLQHQLLSQQVTSQLQRQLHNQFAVAPQLMHATQSSDNEDEDGDNFTSSAQGFYDYASDVVASQLHQQALMQNNANNNNTSNNNNNNGDNNTSSTGDAPGNQTSSFLMDKNKKLFPQKLWELIHNPSIQHCLRWSQDGQRVYLNRNEFEAYYLKTPNNQFHTQKAISFVRQMNMYGFRKVDDCYYENDNFRRDQQHLLRNMIRRHPNKGLFVGLDHHQLVAAAAAQQSHQHHLHLNHHQLAQHHHHHFAESINQQKQRAATEQALRLYYLNSAAAAAAAAGDGNNSNNNNNNSSNNGANQANNQNHHHHHLNQFNPSILAHAAAAGLQANKQHSIEQQLAQVAALSHHHNQLQQQSLRSQLSSLATKNQSELVNATLLDNKQPNQQQHQPKKSRLLNNFYSSSCATNNFDATSNRTAAPATTTTTTTTTAAATKLGAKMEATCNSSTNQLSGAQHHHNQDSMSSVDTQCSSSLAGNSASAGSPQPNADTLIGPNGKLMGAQLKHQQSSAATIASIRAAVLAAGAKHESVAQLNQLIAGEFASEHDGLGNEDDDDEIDEGDDEDEDEDVDGARGQLSEQRQQLAATDLSGNSAASSLAARQAQLHQTLVRSLLQLKQQQQQQHNHHHALQAQDFLSSLQRQPPVDTRSLLESLASLSSAGTGSSIDPTSNSPTERTATPPSRSPSPSLEVSEGADGERAEEGNSEAADEGERASKHDKALSEKTSEPASRSFLNEAQEPGDMALDLAKTSEFTRQRRHSSDESATNEEKPRIQREFNNNNHNHHLHSHHLHHHPATSEPPMDSAKKVRRFLDNQMMIKGKRSKENSPSPVDSSVSASPMKRVKLELEELQQQQQQSRQQQHEQAPGQGNATESLTKSLIVEICERRGDQLNVDALHEAARYTECFLEILIDDASLIARHSSNNSASASTTADDLDEAADSTEQAAKVAAKSQPSSRSSSSSSLDESEDDDKCKSDAASAPATPGVIDASSLSLALKLIPTKLLAAIQQ